MLQVIILISRYNTRDDIRFKTNEINNVKVNYYVLIIIEEIKRFSREIIIFSVYVIFKKSGSISAIKLKV